MPSKDKHRYKSCTAPIGEYCSKHGVIHREEKKLPVNEKTERVNERLTNKLRIKSNHEIGCGLEAFANILENRDYIGLAMKLREIASVIK